MRRPIQKPEVIVQEGSLPLLNSLKLVLAWGHPSIGTRRDSLLADINLAIWHRERPLLGAWLDKKPPLFGQKTPLEGRQVEQLKITKHLGTFEKVKLHLIGSYFVKPIIYKFHRLAAEVKCLFILDVRFHFLIWIGGSITFIELLLARSILTSSSCSLCKEGWIEGQWIYKPALHKLQIVIQTIDTHNNYATWQASFASGKLRSNMNVAFYMLKARRDVCLKSKWIWEHTFWSWGPIVYHGRILIGRRWPVLGWMVTIK